MAINLILSESFVESVIFEYRNILTQPFFIFYAKLKLIEQSKDSLLRTLLLATGYGLLCKILSSY